jgi:CO/xanthine dehydrogenase Mo-binding subunit
MSAPVSPSIPAGAVSRRAFLHASGALVIGFSLAPDLVAAQDRARLPGSLNTNRMLGAWLSIGPNGRVTIFTGKIELGQGIGTALVQIAADELDVDLARIDVVSGDTSRTPNEGQTAGSLSVEQSGTALRFAGAEARHLLLAAAATRLGAPASELKVVDGTVTAPGGAVATYWDLAGEVNLAREATAAVQPKPASAYAWVGKSIARRDIPKKFTGGAAYVQDVRLPGMLFGRVVRPPSPGAQLLAADEAAAGRLPGVVAVVRDGSFLGVAAEREEQAIRAREALKKSARWRETAVLPPAGDALYQYMMARPGPPAETVTHKRSPTAAAPAKTVSATYTRPFQCHASIGPSCAVAQWQAGRLTVWTHSQGVFPLRADLAKVFGLDAKDIRCIHAEGAGCYGHNGADDVALDGALVARVTGGRPVKLQWMREDEFQWEPYGSAMVMKLSGSLDAQGGIVDWTHEVWSHPHTTRPGAADGVNLLAAWHLAKPLAPPFPADVPQPAGGAARNAIPLYDLPNVTVVKHYRKRTA